MITDYFSYHIVLGGTILTSVIILLITNQFTKEYIKIWVVYILVIVISIIVALRGSNIGLDTLNYYKIYSGTYRIQVEPGILLIAELFKLIPGGVFFYLFVISLITNLSILLAFRKLHSEYLLLYTMYLVSFVFINLNINIIRQGLSIGLGILAVAYFCNKRFYKYLIFSIFAILTHYSSLYLLLLVLAYNFKVSKTLVLGIVASIFLLSYFSMIDIFKLLSPVHQLFFLLYSYFSWSIKKAWSIKHVYYLVFILYFYNLYLFYRIKNSQVEQRLFIAYSIGIILIFVLKEEEMVVDRVFYLFFILGLGLVSNFKILFLQKHLYYLGVLIGVLGWYFKSYILQYPTWFIPPFEAIR